jgi:hypothetical protein
MVSIHCQRKRKWREGGKKEKEKEGGKEERRKERR